LPPDLTARPTLAEEGATRTVGYSTGGNAPLAGRKTYRLGTHRVTDPAETLGVFEQCRQRLGITRVGVVTGLDSIGIPVVTVFRPNARSLSVAQGKGVDLPAAKASGLGESIEAWHAEHVLLPLRLASWRELAAVAPVVAVDQLARRVSSSFTPDGSILWVEGTDLLSGKAVWAPYETVHLDFRVPGPQGTGCFHGSSNGLAAGNHLLEALSHALCEVIERDAVALWRWRGSAGRDASRVALDTVDDPVCRDLLVRFAAAGVDVEVFDATSDVGLATFSVAIADRDSDPTRRLPAAAGHGCHPCRAVALSRALTEAAQSRLTMISGSRDDVTWAAYDLNRDWAQLQAIRADLDDSRPRRSFHDVPDHHLPAVGDDVTLALDRLRTVGVPEVAFFDLTRADVGIPVVRVVVPGLESHPGVVTDLCIGRRGRAVAAPTG
jgi:YcaO-like protein with predicted kinase domain